MPIGQTVAHVVVISGSHQVALDKGGMVHFKDTQMILLCPNTVLLMHGLTMHAGRHNQGMENDSLRLFARVQVWFLKGFHPPYASLMPGTFYTDGLQVCNWHMCTTCRGGRGPDMDMQELLCLNKDHFGDWEHDGWIILKVQHFARVKEGLFNAQSFYLHPLW